MGVFSKTLPPKPSLNLLVETLVTAAYAVDPDMGLSVERSDWEKTIHNLREVPEGICTFPETGNTAEVVCLSWWSDRQQARHFRVWTQETNLAGKASKTPYPPVRHVYPERIFYREQGTSFKWCAVCPCGVCDVPDKIAWTGEQCGPCSDAASYSEPRPRVAAAATFQHDNSSRSVPLFIPTETGFQLVTKDAAQPRVLIRDAFAKPESVAAIPQVGEFGYPTVSPNGRFLASTVHENRFQIMCTDSNRVVFDHQEQFPIRGLIFSPVGSDLAVFGSSGMQLWSPRHHGESWVLVGVADAEVHAAAFSPGGDLLLLGGRNSFHVFHTVLGTELNDLSNLYGGVPCQMVCTRLPNHGYRLTSLHDNTPNVRIADLIDGQVIQRQFHTLESLTRGTLSADGSLLAWFRRGEPLVRLFDVHTGEKLGGVAWDLSSKPAQVVFAEDGEHLAIVSETGTGKIIPWKYLLQQQTKEIIRC